MFVFKKYFLYCKYFCLLSNKLYIEKIIYFYIIWLYVSLLAQMKTSGTHIIWDLYECNFDFFIHKHSHQYLKEFFEQKVKDAGLTIIWSMIHTFENQSFSLNIMLSESHFCIHTWPEIHYISVDLFVCNYSRDNTLLAEKLFNSFMPFFQSNKPSINILKR